MAKYTKTMQGDIDDFVAYLKDKILKGSFTASLEEEEHYRNAVSYSVLVFERYSYIGSNRLSLSITIVQEHDSLRLVAVSSGGSQAVLFKVNTFGEDSFLGKLIKIIEAY